MKVTSCYNNGISRPVQDDLFDHTGRVSDRHRVYECWSLEGEKELFISRSCFYSRVIFYFRPGLFEVAANSTRRVTWSDDNAYSIHTLFRVARQFGQKL